MKKNTPLNDDEIDLIALLMVIWNGKIKILLITIISFLVGIGYSYQVPNNYVNTLTLSAVDNSEFKRLKYVNRLLQTAEPIRLN